MTTDNKTAEEMSEYEKIKIWTEMCSHTELRRRMSELKREGYSKDDIINIYFPEYSHKMSINTKKEKLPSI